MFLLISFYYIVNNYLLPLFISRFPRFSIDPRTPTLNSEGLAFWRVCYCPHFLIMGIPGFSEMSAIVTNE